MAKEGAKTSKERPNIALWGLQEGLKMAQDGPGAAQNCPERSHEGPRGPQDGSKGPQEDSKERLQEPKSLNSHGILKDFSVLAFFGSQRTMTAQAASKKPTRRPTRPPKGPRARKGHLCGGR
eukprot:2520945-Pyramimonas_sp.AAC.1